MRKSLYRRNYRFPMLGFWTGAACVLSLNGAFAPTIAHLHGNARTIQEVDACALATDWAMIGKDCLKVLDKLGEKEASSTATT